MGRCSLINIHMKRLKKMFKWIGIVLLIVVLSIAAVTVLRQNLHYNAPYPGIRASADSSVIARGRHLIRGAAHCVYCHSTANVDSIMNAGGEVALSGDRLFKLPVGKIYSKNITPDKETGIGNFTDGEIARVLRYSVHPDGTVVYGFMQFHNASDEDLTAIISYLRSRPAIKNPVPEHKLNLLGNVVKAFMVKPDGPSGPVPAAVTNDTTAAYGKYLAISIAECNGCHTRRDVSGAFTGAPFAGGETMEEEGFTTVPPNLTPDSSGRIFGWTQQHFIDRFRMGKLIPQSPMPWNSFKNMTDDELKAIYKFLQTVKPVRTAM